MEIIQIVSDLNSGGVQKFVSSLCNQISKKSDCHCIVLTGNKSIYNISQAVKLTYLNCSSLKYYNLFNYIKVYKKLKKISKKNVILHTHGISLLFCLAFNLLNRRKFKKIHTIHNLAQNESGPARRLLNQFQFKYLKVRTVAISKAVARSFLEHYKIKPSVLIYNGICFQQAELGVDLEKILPGNKKNTFVSIGRFDLQKRFDKLLKIIPKIKFETRPVFILIISDTRNSGYRIKKYTGYTIIFCFNRKDVSEILKRAEFYISFSLFEGMPLAHIEALYSCCKVITTPAGGASEVVDKYGIVTQTFDEEEFIKCIENRNSFNWNIDMQKKFAEKKFSMKLCCNQYEKFFEKKD